MDQGAVVVQVNISPGGVPKLPIDGTWVGPRGLRGDDQHDKRHHGSPDQAVCLFALERIEALAAEGHPIGPGSAGENFTTRGIDWDLVVPGARLRIGEALEIEITGYATPCTKNARWFRDGNFNRMNQRRHPGWSRVYAKVLAPGPVRAGDAVRLLPGG